MNLFSHGGLPVEKETMLVAVVAGKKQEAGIEIRAFRKPA
jgi:hypothetical protein